MDPSVPPIANLPPELLCLVVQALNPISLITLSQTNKFFRSFISPQRIHFVQRLLALELLPEHGGIVPLFNARRNTFRPPPQSPEWNQNKYACSGCLKLLTHKMFDNHSVYGLSLRKPPPGSEEAMKLTDWEPPGNEVGWWIRRQRQQSNEQDRLKPYRTEYATATRSLGDPVNGPQPPNGFLLTGSDDAKDDKLAKDAENILCGRSRHRRLCLECKRIRGVFTRRTRSSIGTPDVPMVFTRQVPVADPLSLCFPRSIHGVPEPPLPRILRVNRPNCNIYLRTPLVMFCPHCSTWQDMWAFGLYTIEFITYGLEVAGSGTLSNFDPGDPQKSDYKAFMCFHCIASTHGIDRLRETLLQLFLELAERSAHKIRGRLSLGWGQFWGEFYWNPRHRAVLNKPKYHAARRRIFGPEDDGSQDASHRFHNLGVTAHGPMVTKPDPTYLASKTVKDAVEELRRCLRELRRFLYNEATLSDQMEATETWQGIWLEDYEDNEQALFYSYYLMASVRNDPQRLVDYALHPDRFRYPRPPLSSFQQDILEHEKQGARRYPSRQDRKFRNPKPSRKNIENELAWKDMYLKAKDRAQAQRKNLESLQATRA